MIRSRWGLVTAASSVIALLVLGAFTWPDDDLAPVTYLGGPSTALSDPRSIAIDSDGRLYVSNYDNDSITVYPPGWRTGDVAPERVLDGPATQLANPQGIALDNQDRLYVTNFNSVTVYAAGFASGDTAPIKVLRGANTGLFTPMAVAFDSTGRMYVVNRYDRIYFPGLDNSGTITVYAKEWADGDTRPVAVLGGASAGLTRPRDIAFDTQGRVYVTDRDRVMVYPATWTPGDVRPILRLSGPETNLISPSGITVDKAGNVYVSNYLPEEATDVEPSINVYQFDWGGGGVASDAAPNVIIRGPRTGLDHSAGILLDATGRLYVANGGSNSVTAYIPRTQTLSTSVTSSVQLNTKSFTASATSDRGLPVSVFSMTPNVCQGSGIAPVSITVTSLGRCVVEFRQGGDAEWPPAPTISLTVNVTASSQSVQIEPLADVLASAGPIVLRGSTTSGLPIVWSASPSSVCSVSGAFGYLLELRSPGTCNITGSQPGNGLWNSASASSSFEVLAPPPPSITITCTKAEQRGRAVVQCAGTSQEMTVGTTLQPHVRARDTVEWRALGTSKRPQISADGSFTWTYPVRKQKQLQVYFSHGEVKSNEATIALAP